MSYKKLLGVFALALTLFKFVFAAAIVTLLAGREAAPAAALIMLLMISDIFDGVLFRRSAYAGNARLSMARRAIDSMGDVLVINAVLIVMIFLYGFPVALYALALLRMALTGALLLSGHVSRDNSLLGVNNSLASWLASASTGLMAISWLIFGAFATIFFAGLFVIFTAIGLAEHYRKIHARPLPSQV